jgi:hypothetical protein
LTPYKKHVFIVFVEHELNNNYMGYGMERTLLHESMKMALKIHESSNAMDDTMQIDVTSQNTSSVVVGTGRRRVITTWERMAAWTRDGETTTAPSREQESEQAKERPQRGW